MELSHTYVWKAKKKEKKKKTKVFGCLTLGNEIWGKASCYKAARERNRVERIQDAAQGGSPQSRGMLQ